MNDSITIPPSEPAAKVAAKDAEKVSDQVAENAPAQPESIPAKMPSAPHPVQAARALLKKLQQDFPLFRDCLPLAIGIDKQLIVQQPELPRKLLRIALGQHTNSLRYLKSLEKSTHRFNLDGQPAEPLTDEHRKHAATSLRERFKKEADQRRAQRAAEEAAHAAAEAARLHVEKLNQLAAKFAK